MQKFSKFAEKYKNWKAMAHPGEPVDSYDMAFLRESYSKLVNAEKRNNKRLLVENLRQWKIKNGKGNKITARDLQVVKMVEAKLAEEKVTALKETKFQNALRQFAAYKEARGLGPVTRSERARIFEKTQATGSSRIAHKATVKSVFSKINESKKCVAIAKRRLSEGDVMGAADATMAAGQAVNGAEADATTMATPAAPIPQEVVDQISQVKNAVDTLATQAGIASPVDMGADPNAGIPAVTGAPADTGADAGMDAGMDGQQPVMESRMNAARNRIFEKKCDCGKTGLEVPSVAEIVKGTVSGASKEAAPADTWPTAKLGEVPMTKKLGNVKESEEFSPDVDENGEEVTEKMDETMGLAEQRLEYELSKKHFNWGDYLKSGFNKN